VVEHVIKTYGKLTGPMSELYGGQGNGDPVGHRGAQKHDTEVRGRLETIDGGQNHHGRGNA